MCETDRRSSAPPRPSGAALAPRHRPSAGRAGDGLVVFRSLRCLGLVWVAVTVPGVTWLSSYAHSPEAYIFVLVYLASGTYTAPGLVVGWYTLLRAPDDARLGFRMLYAGLCMTFLIGVGLLVGLVTGWRWANVLGVPAVGISGLAHIVGLAILVRTRSGRRALSVDIVEAVAAVVAVTAPLVVLWGPSVVRSEQAWFTVPCSLVLMFTIAGVYWTTVLCVRLGPGRRAFQVCALALTCVGVVNSSLQMAQGVANFTLPAPPLIALSSLTASMYLLVPLYVPEFLPPGLSRLPPQAQVRGARLATVVALAGIGALLAATAHVADERPWAVAFSLGVVTLLFVLAALRQLAAFGETRRLYRQVELASEERGRLLTQMLERSVQDRRRFAGQLHEQAVSAAASFATLAGAGYAPRGASPLVTEASALVRGELGRHADSLRDLVLAIRSRDGDRRSRERLGTPIAAHLASVYGDGPTPHLTVEVAESLVLDWVTETVVLQIVHEALHNVWRHSQAAAVDVSIGTAGTTVAVQVADDGVGFDPAQVPEGPGLASMRSSAAVVGGTVTITSAPGSGTVVAARLGAGGEAWPPPSEAGTAPSWPPALRLVPDLPVEDEEE
ncbi:MAG TPA: ATP-binding protein [Acidimicrobiales bacterium]|nr:ATP-binding protein [Acidimicrobiales bacterium]